MQHACKHAQLSNTNDRNHVLPPGKPVHASRTPASENVCIALNQSTQMSTEMSFSTSRQVQCSMPPPGNTRRTKLLDKCLALLFVCRPAVLQLVAFKHDRCSLGLDEHEVGQCSDQSQYQCACDSVAHVCFKVCASAKENSAAEADQREVPAEILSASQRKQPRRTNMLLHIFAAHVRHTQPTTRQSQQWQVEFAQWEKLCLKFSKRLPL